MKTLLSMTTLYTEHRSSSRDMNERNDCAVVAVAIVCGVDYKVAHAALAAEGRKPRRGTYNAMTQSAIKKLGKTLRPIRTRDIIETYPMPHRRNCQYVTTHHPRRFPKSWDPKKVYLISVRGHILAVKNGEVQDWSRNKSMRVLSIYEVC